LIFARCRLALTVARAEGAPSIGVLDLPMIRESRLKMSHTLGHSVAATGLAQPTHTNSRIVQRYSQCYEQLRSLCTHPRQLREDTLLRCVETAALYASAHHPGRLFDGAIENVALEIGKNLDRNTVAEARAYLRQRPLRDGRSDKYRVLHVSPGAWQIGGHTRTLRNWITIDQESRHSVLFTQAVDPALVAGIGEDLRRGGGESIVLPGRMGLLVKAQVLRSIAQSSADLIVLHHSCNDVVPVVAFATSDLPPVAFVNDCDHAFWLGSSVADIIVNHREAGARWSEARRAPAVNAVLPIPLAEPESCVGREEARRILGIPPDRLVLLTVGRAVKYRPTASHDFLKTLRKVLNGVPNSHLYVVGLSADEALEWQLDWKHPEIHLYGANPDPSIHRAAADLYLESMPFGSATALLEAGRQGLPVVLPFAPTCELLVTNHGLEDLLSNPPTEEEYIRQVQCLLNNVEERKRLGESLRNRICSQHTGEGWRRQLAGLCAHARALKHEPRPIPTTDCAVSVLDIAVSEWQAFLNGDVASATRDARTVREIALMGAYRALWHREYRGALELLWRCLCAFGLDTGLLVAAARVPAREVYRRCWPSLGGRVRNFFPA